jgi:branched-chain amino acid transport system permease protein
MGVTRFCKRTYDQDLQIFQSPAARISLLLLLFFLLAFPTFGGRYLCYVLSLCGIAVIGALGINILTGYTGLVSMGHAAFVGIGAYTAAILASRMGTPFWLCLVAGGAIPALAGLIVAIPSLRLKGLYIVVTTLAFQFITEHIIYHWESLTLGDKGIQVPYANLFGFSFDSHTKFYYLILFVALAVAVFTKNLAMTRTGRAFIAIRDRDVSAEIIGVNLCKYKIMAFTVSSFMAGLAGALFAFLNNLISPDHFTFALSIQYLAMIIVGGMGTVLGSIIGAFFMTLLPEALAAATGPLSSAYPLLASRIGAVSTIVYGLIIILFLILEPAGIFGIWLRVKYYWKQWPFKY